MRLILIGAALVILSACANVSAPSDGASYADSSARCVTYEIYQDAADDWRWRKLSGGKVTATPGQQYSSKSNAMRAAKIDSTSDCDKFEYASE
ncbi:MAG: hypothetical protein A3E78_17290 [Alphaproteobacteria bacterium RIFCSPHIGHO2_12_FULL_63_12]|nr:MAG: hypothetical protein A3E78_17290 [Alphaproteobacteria bacterium RIFCSPHIGHO2_12_FULL_63_12]